MTAEAPPAAEIEPGDEPARSDASAHLHRAGRAFTGKQLLLLAAITVLGGALRLWCLGDWSFWVDEANTWRDVTMPLGQFFDFGADESHGRWSYPTSFLLLRWLLDSGWLHSFSEGWLRLPFAFCGIVTVPMFALFGHHMVGRRAALLATLFLAINPWHIYWSQNARAYVLVFMFAVAAAGCFWLGVARRQRRLVVLAVFLALLAGSCHTTGFVLLPVFVAYPLLAARSLRGRRMILALLLAGIGLTLLPDLLVMLPPFRKFAAAKSDASLLHLLQTTAFYFRLPLLCAAAVGTGLLLRTRLQGQALFLACWALLPPLLIGIVGSTMVKTTARYIFSAVPAVLLLAGVAAVRTGDVLKRELGSGPRWLGWLPRALVPAILCLDMVAYDYMYFAVQHGDRGRWREASDVVVRAAGDKAFRVVSTSETSLMYYLRPNIYRAGGAAIPGPAVASLVDWDLERGGADYVRDLASTTAAQGRQLYFVVGLPELGEKDADGSLRAAIERDCELLKVLPCWVGPKDESIYVYRWRGPR